MMYSVLRSFALVSLLEHVRCQVPIPAPVPMPIPMPMPVPATTSEVPATQVPTPPTLPEETPPEFLLINWQIGVGVENVLEIDPGTTVLWNWTDPGRTHTVTETGHTPSIFNSDEHLTPFAYWFTFGEEYAGQTFPYRCNVHRTAMIGEIRVGEGVSDAPRAYSTNFIIVACAVSAIVALVAA